MQHTDGIIIILSYPDTVVRPAYWEISSKIWPKIGIGSKHAIQAGHAALLLIQKDNPKINYFDFGRYITTYGNGRVRSKETDPELEIPLHAEFKNGILSNLENILLWIESHPDKTHGEGRLIASVNTAIDYFKAKDFINDLIKQKEIPYGAFIKKGTNCARFVTDTILHSCHKKSIKLKLKASYLLTPSPIGNVIKGTTEEKVYTIFKQELKEYSNRSIVKEYKASFFNKFDKELILEGTELPNKKHFNLPKGTWLGGIGSGAWFKIEAKLNQKFYKIARYTSNGNKDFEGLFNAKNVNFNPKEEHHFIHPTNCFEVFIKQNEEVFSFKRSS
ncbi:hypothetical protein MC378_01205 [Polaribacter sp. MSW13]|uniref:Uncharacterized protein n=1 Tax=Polaribacter marinus TaxID=2916838 RepID=A0A9X1VJN9_9FLAO|nr:DUF6695 family protein [Polaribacter marinus]MCI2227764.1 hypothetical protein [Polaribacter marinus]